jgi:hypothetical protein
MAEFTFNSVASIKRWRLKRIEKMVAVETAEGIQIIPLDIAHHLQLNYWKI